MYYETNFVLCTLSLNYVRKWKSFNTVRRFVDQKIVGVQTAENNTR